MTIVADENTAAAAPPPRLTEDTIAAFLTEHGVSCGPHPRIQALGGGVSADIFAVESPSGAWVVKQALPQLRVRQDWHATPERALTEARALQLAAEIIPEAVPPLVLTDASTYSLVMGKAPANLENLKTTLLRDGGSTTLDTAAALGRLLATWHLATAGRGEVSEHFGDTDSFLQLRIDPFHRAVAAAHPDLATELEELVRDLLTRPVCVVHGDFSPKNILADSTDVWLLDWEVAHYGNPDFDLAFMLAHLVCKSIYLPQHAESYRQNAEQFMTAYTALTTGVLPAAGENLTAHVAALVLARADGKSPADYLDTHSRTLARRLGRSWLRTPPTTVDELWESLT